jgi:hypothetical protein
MAGDSPIAAGLRAAAMARRQRRLIEPLPAVAVFSTVGLPL